MLKTPNHFSSPSPPKRAGDARLMTWSCDTTTRARARAGIGQLIWNIHCMGGRVGDVGVCGGGEQTSRTCLGIGFVTSGFVINELGWFSLLEWSRLISFTWERERKNTIGLDVSNASAGLLPDWLSYPWWRCDVFVQNNNIFEFWIVLCTMF